MRNLLFTSSFNKFQFQPVLKHDILIGFNVPDELVVTPRLIQVGMAKIKMISNERKEKSAVKVSWIAICVDIFVVQSVMFNPEVNA